MVFLLTVATMAYFAGVLWIARSMRRLSSRHTAMQPDADQAPASAVGWPPEGDGFTTYVDEGIAALDAYLSQGYAA